MSYIQVINAWRMTYAYLDGASAKAVITRAAFQNATAWTAESSETVSMTVPVTVGKGKYYVIAAVNSTGVLTPYAGAEWTFIGADVTHIPQLPAGYTALYVALTYYGMSSFDMSLVIDARIDSVPPSITLDANADTVLSLFAGVLGLDTEAANTVWAGAVSGGAAVPAFRALVADDIPAGIPDEKISHDKLGTPTLYTLHDDWITRGSAGVTDGTLTYLAVGSTAVKVTVAAGQGYIRVSDDQQAELKFCTWPLSTDLYTFSAPAAGLETAVFFGISYNAGTPIAITSSTFSDFNGRDKFWLGRATYDGTNMEILNSYAHSEDTAHLARLWMRLNFPFNRENPPEGSGGFELATSGTNQMSMTAGRMWHGFNNYIINAIAAGAQFDTHYGNGSGGFVSSTATAWNATQYDNGSGTLQTMTNNRYGTRWVYLDVAKNSVVGAAYNAQLDMIYGTSNAVSVATAQAETAPSVPSHLQYHGRLIARIIFQKSATASTLVESAWTNVFAATAVGNHALLSNLDYASAAHTGFASGAITGPVTNILTITNAAASILALAITAGKTITLTATDNSGLTFTGASTLTVPATGQALVHTSPTVAGYIPFFSTTAGVVSSSASLFWDNGNSRLGVGTVAPSVRFHISVDGSVPASTLFTTADNQLLTNLNANTNLRIVTASTGNLSRLLLTGTRGTLVTPTTMVSGDGIGTINFQAFDGTALRNAALISADVDATVSTGIVPGRLLLQTTNLSGALTERVRIDSVGIVSIAGTAVRGTTIGTNTLQIFDGTAPAGTLANGCSFYSTAGEMRVMDAAGNATLLSPHDDAGNWIFESKNTVTGRMLRIAVEKMLRAINDRFGWDFVKEFTDAS